VWNVVVPVVSRDVSPRQSIFSKSFFEKKLAPLCRSYPGLRFVPKVIPGPAEGQFYEVLYLHLGAKLWPVDARVVVDADMYEVPDDLVARWKDHTSKRSNLPPHIGAAL
jgi:hypothetical protein